MAKARREEYTIGVEEEYQLVDRETGALRSRARTILAGDWSGDIKPELQQNTVEVDTRPCASAAEAREELARLRFQAAVAAEAEGVRVVAAGTHPFSHWEGQEFTSSPTYDAIRAEYRQLADSQNIFGLHVHVALPAGTDRVRVMNAVRHYLPHLLACSASSPSFLGEDTGYVSYRAILWRRWPRTGPPPRMADEAEYAQLVETLVHTRRIDAPGRIYWDLRPHHLYPTLEIRVADATPTLDDAAAVASLARLLVVGAVEGVVRDPEIPESLVRALLVENLWRASRDGVAAEVVDYTGGAVVPVPLREWTAELVGRLAPLAAELGDEAAVEALRAVLARGSAAERARDLGAVSDPRALVEWLAEETVLGVGLDRRREQRPAVPAG